MSHLRFHSFIRLPPRGEAVGPCGGCRVSYGRVRRTVRAASRAADASDQFGIRDPDARYVHYRRSEPIWRGAMCEE
ncbi:MAG: hypothetical protein ACKVS9_02490 [Phycisphaerae bacterium]